MFQNRLENSVFLATAFQIVKSVLAALAVCIVGAVTFAFLLRFFNNIKGQATACLARSARKVLSLIYCFAIYFYRFSINFY